MASNGKRLTGLKAKVDRTTDYNLDDALKLVRETVSAKFDETVEVAINLGVNARKSDPARCGSGDCVVAKSCSHVSCSVPQTVLSASIVLC